MSSLNGQQCFFYVCRAGVMDLGGLARPSVPPCRSKSNIEIFIIYLTKTRADRKKNQIILFIGRIHIFYWSRNSAPLYQNV